MTDFHGIDEADYQQIKTEAMTNLVAQLYIDAYLENHLTTQEVSGKLPDPLPAIYVYNIRQTAMDQFNAWMRVIREQP